MQQIVGIIEKSVLMMLYYVKQGEIHICYRCSLQSVSCTNLHKRYLYVFYRVIQESMNYWVRANRCKYPKELCYKFFSFFKSLYTIWCTGICYSYTGPHKIIFKYFLVWAVEMRFVAWNKLFLDNSTSI